MRKHRRARFWLAGHGEDIESFYPTVEHRDTWAAERARRSIDAMSEADWVAAFARNRRYEKELLPPPPRFISTDQGESRRPWTFLLLLVLVSGALLTPVFLGGLPWPSQIRGFKPSRPTHPTLPYSPSTTKLDKWIRDEAQFAYKRVLDNIGPAAGVPDGVVIASPSTGDDGEPDYFYTWTRDAALTISSLLSQFLPESYLIPWDARWSSDAPLQRAHKASHPLLEGLVRSYATFQARIQSNPNPSGDLWTGGLSEPKFDVSGSAFTGSWGRPQRDGPALRALALIPYAHWLLDRGFPADLAYVRESLYDPDSLRRPGSVVKNDLEEVANSWYKASFDVWEEVDAHHLWTDAVARRALQAGAGLAARLGDNHASAFYANQAERVGQQIRSYHNGEWRATDHPGLRTGLDAAILLASLHTGGGNEIEDLDPSHPSILDTLGSYVISFEGLYPQNTGNWTDGWLVGRYAEDIYDGVGFTGGNPWYITTFAVATTLYRAQRALAETGEVTEAAIWTDLGVQGQGLERALAALGRVADAFVIKAARTMPGGRMSEQIGPEGQRGARDLTWSYAAFLELRRAREAGRKALSEASTSMNHAAPQNGQRPRLVSPAASFFAAVNAGQSFNGAPPSAGAAASKPSNEQHDASHHQLGRSQSMKNPPRSDGPLSFAAVGAGLQSPPSSESQYIPPAAARHPLFSHHARPPPPMHPWSPALSYTSDPGPVPPITIDPNCPPSPGSTVSSAFSPASAFLQAFSLSSGPSEPACDAQGAHVLDYTLGKVLARGGFSTVRSATHNTTGKVFACKIVTRDDISDESGSAARFEDEIRIWQSLPSHPAILPLIEMKRTDFATFMIMPLLQGSLLDILRIEGGSESTARKWFPGCVAAVAALHEGFEGFKGHMMHGDLKLENFLVDTAGHVYVGDFGMSHNVDNQPPKRGPSPANRPSNLPAHLQARGRLVSAPDSPRNPSRSPARRRDTLATSEVIQPANQPCPSASLPYASPELLNAPPSRPALNQDIWALGIILHALLTGRLPFNDSFDPRLQMKILRGNWEDPYVSHEWLEALHGTLTRDPARRWDIRRVCECDAVTGWREVRTKSRSRSRARIPDHGRRAVSDSPMHQHHEGARRGRSRSRPSSHMRHESQEDRGQFLHTQDGHRSRSQSGPRKPGTPSRPSSMRMAHPEALAAELDGMMITRGRSAQREERTPGSSAGSGERAAGTESRSPSSRPARPLSGAEQRRGRSIAREVAVPGTAGWWEAQAAHARYEGTPPGSGTPSGVHSGAHTPPRDASSRPPTLGFELDVVEENAPARGRAGAGGRGPSRSKSRGRPDRI
ncbi:hypothetical protein CspHIS471_0206880 [Cutaneotrichosporon sp. HIS471]|nr:hypothetical protein CspHIS471_0206880 [Cutaneotrichosporon sp. HIS471]